MNDIDKWAAEQCGVELHCTHKAGRYIELFWEDGDMEWTIQDPRCREIFRNLLFEQGYILNAGKALWVYKKPHKSYEAHKKDFHSGVDEVACITAIYENDKDNTNITTD